jgi:hypothetical protein
MHKAHKKMLPASITEGDAEGAEEEEYEYGDVESIFNKLWPKY